ncbi:hypothetical protein AHGSH82_025960 [Aeromonas hydrophila]|nr:hypothetical protein AHGSH82_025960 [Aeromonas hydrophila]BBT62753.1 hypothetical protein WP8S18E02_25500 [Aeromonas hydrophila]
MIQVVQIIALPLSLFCPALQQFSPRPAYPSDSKHNDSPSLRLSRNCPAMIWHSPCRITGLAIINVPIGRAAGSEGHCAKTCQSRLDRRHTSGQDQPSGLRPLAYTAANALPHLINRNACHARQAPADTKRLLSHHHGERARESHLAPYQGAPGPAEEPSATGHVFRPFLPFSHPASRLMQSTHWPLTPYHELPTIAQTHHVSEITS